MSALAEIRRIVIEELREGRDCSRDDQHIASRIADRVADWVPEPASNVCPDCSGAAA